MTDLATPEELRVLRGGLAAAKDRRLRMWSLPVDQIARLVASAEASVLDGGETACVCGTWLGWNGRYRPGAHHQDCNASGAGLRAQRRLISALRVKAARTLKNAVTEEFLAWLEGEADPLAALEK